jgi:hypothetical protein
VSCLYRSTCLGITINPKLTMSWEYMSPRDKQGYHGITIDPELTISVDA